MVSSLNLDPNQQFTDEALVRLALAEDSWQSDITARQLSEFMRSQTKPLPASREFVVWAKCGGIFSGSRWTNAFSKVLEHEIRLLKQEGEEFSKGDILLVGQASPLDILSFERTLLNGLQMMCGVATQTFAYVDCVTQAAKKISLAECPGVYHTRKTIPLLRDLQIAAVVAGGGRAHRRDLSSRVLIKENHKYLVQEQRLAFEKYVEFCLQTYPDALVEVENFDEAMAVASVGAKFLMLDNFEPAAIQKTLKRLAGRVEVEISGGLSLDRIGDYVMPGVQRLSVGALTHGARALDLSLDWKRL